MNKQLTQQNTSCFDRSKQQNFQGEVTSGFIMRLEKQTQENRRVGRQPINNKGEYEKQKKQIRFRTLSI
jgi:hypothetical protein